MFSNNKLTNRKYFLIAGLVAMLFAGVIYAWSILKVPFKTELGFADSQLSLCFTFTMCTFCLGAFFGSKLYKKIGVTLTCVIAGALSGLGFFLTGCVPLNPILLYVFYALFGGLGIGVAYNVIISVVNSWYPDKKGFSSGVLLMGFGASTLILGNVIDLLFKAEGVGFKNTYMLLGAVIAAAIILAGLVIKAPAADVMFPQPKKVTKANTENFEVADFTTPQMIKRFTFWRAFILLVFLTAVGNSVISFARDLVLSVGATDSWAATLVGVLAVCNGLGRIVTGVLFDKLGRRFAMLFSNLLTTFAALTTLVSILLGSLPICVFGLCLTGLSYGSCPTVCSAFVSAFYGTKYFSTNFSIINFNLIAASFIATLSNNLFIISGGYTLPFVVLFLLSLVALALNFSIKRP